MARLDLIGGGQVVVDGNYAFVGHMKPPHGTSIIDVSDPKNPKLVTTIMLPDNNSHTHKVRVVGDIMIVNVEMNDRHFLRKGEKIPAVTRAAGGEAEAAADRRGGRRRAAREGKRSAAAADYLQNGYKDGGFRIYDIIDRANPKLLAHHRTHGFGTHRFDMDERYAYISTEMPGYVGNILMVYDIKDPAKPEEVSRWWMPGQHIAGGEKPTWRGYSHRLHHAMRFGNEFWASVWFAGIRVLDCSDITKLKVIGQHNYHPPFPEPTHTVVPLPKKFNGRRYAAAVDEEHDHIPGQPHAGLWFFDVEDLANIKPVAMFHLQEFSVPVQPRDLALWRASVPGADRRRYLVLHLVLRRAAHDRRQRPDRAAGNRLVHPRAGRRPEGPGHQRRLRRQARADLHHRSRQGIRHHRTDGRSRARCSTTTTRALNGRPSSRIWSAAYTGERLPADTVQNLSPAGKPLLVRYDLAGVKKALTQGSAGRSVRRTSGVTASFCRYAARPTSSASAKR